MNWYSNPENDFWLTFFDSKYFADHHELRSEYEDRRWSEGGKYIRWDFLPGLDGIKKKPKKDQYRKALEYVAETIRSKFSRNDCTLRLLKLFTDRIIAQRRRRLDHHTTLFESIKEYPHVLLFSSKPTPIRNHEDIFLLWVDIRKAIIWKQSLYLAIDPFIALSFIILAFVIYAFPSKFTPIFLLLVFLQISYDLTSGGGFFIRIKHMVMEFIFFFSVIYALGIVSRWINISHFFGF